MTAHAAVSSFGSKRIATRTLGRAGFWWALAYVPIHVYWGLGGSSTPIGITGAQDDFAVANWGACVVITGAGLVCLSLTSRWGQLLPAALRRGTAWVGGAAALAHWVLFTVASTLRLVGVVGYPSHGDVTAAQLRGFDWANLAYFELWFGVMGVLLVLCARRDRALEALRGRPMPLTRTARLGTGLSLAGIGVVVWGVFTFDAWLFVAVGPAVLAAGLGILASVGGGGAVLGGHAPGRSVARGGRSGGLALAHAVAQRGARGRVPDRPDQQP
ncbi:MAG TPA: hypothetical protein VFT67_05345 [Jatrophihabitantaceae bacterium]|nr:hypothetical protein [Jatrophihabitantaceae bacterium]